MTNFDNKFIDEIKQIDESHRIDFKEQYSDTIRKDIIAFSNNEGGKIIIGISDKKPRTVKNVDFEEIEQRISNYLNDLKIVPKIRYKKYRYKDSDSDSNFKLVVFIIVYPSGIPIQDPQGRFLFRDFGSSHNRYLSFQELKDRFLLKEKQKEEYMKWINQQISEKKDSVFFLLSPYSTEKNFINFSSQREIYNMFNSSESNGITISGQNQNFFHPIKQILSEMQIFRDAEIFTTDDYCVYHEIRTGNQLIIFENGCIYGKIQYAIKRPDLTNHFNPDNLFENEELYCATREDLIFSEFQKGSLLRTVACMIYFLSAQKCDWKKYEIYNFNLTLNLPVNSSEKLHTEIFFDTREYLGLENQIKFSSDLIIDLLSIQMEINKGSAKREEIYCRSISNSINALEEIIKHKIWSYFGQKSVTFFEGSRKDDYKPNYNKKELELKWRLEFENQIKIFLSFFLLISI